ncbi:ABC transporter permease [Streptomyces sp. NPDC003442]
MTLPAVERIKLFSTRSPTFSIPLALGFAVGLGAMFTSQSDDENPATVGVTQMGYSSGLIVMMAMATLSVTTEYRYNTIRLTFQAAPHRTAVLLAKTGVVVLVSAVTGLIGAFAAWGLGRLVKSDADLALDSGGDWRAVAGVGLVYAVAAVLAVAVGLLVRHSAAAIAVVLVYTLLLETVVTSIPALGGHVRPWLPFKAANYFLTDGQPDRVTEGVSGNAVDYPYGPWIGLLFFVGITAVIYAISLITTQKRDA